jgi:branched-chain amino acid aminotransferase
VTRDLVIEWYDVHERDISMDEFAEADEVFFTSTTRDVQAIHDIDGRALDVHIVTESVAAVWSEREPQDIDP